jgi:uncharacterized membrane protein YccC
MTTTELRTAPRSTPVFDARRVGEAWRSAVPPVLFGLRLWASVCLALYVAFWLELDDPFWAGLSACVVCQPQLGASLRKGWFRLIGTLVGGTMAVVLTACFPQDRAAFLGALALWCAACAFGATVLRNFASYSAALSGYTTAIIAADTLGATGGPHADVFMLAIWRASEISIGIVSAGVILAGTDLGGARRRLAASLADLAAEITGRFAGMLALAGSQLPETQPERQALARRVIALEPTVDQAIGEPSELRYHSSVLQTALHGLFNALAGWRSVAIHLKQLTDDKARQGAATMLNSLPPELRSAPGPGAPTRWMVDPVGLHRSCEESVLALQGLPTGSPSLRLLAEQTTRLLVGVSRVLEGLALLVDAHGLTPRGRRGFRPSVADWLPALVNAGRAFVAIGAVELFWIVTAWPNGAFTIIFAAIIGLLFSPRGDRAAAGALAFLAGSVGGIIAAAVIKFAVLPSLTTFPAFSLAVGAVLVPLGFGIAKSRRPAVIALLTGMTIVFVAGLSPTNEMTYDTVQFYNTALSIFAGCGAAALSFRLVPNLPPAWRAARLLAFARCDLRHLAIDRKPQDSVQWESRMYSRLAALPDQAEPLQRSQLLAALSVGGEVIRLRQMSAPLALGPELDAALTALARGDSAATRAELAGLAHRLAASPRPHPMALQARASIVAISEALAEHDAWLDARGPA